MPNRHALTLIESGRDLAVALGWPENEIRKKTIRRHGRGSSWRGQGCLMPHIDIQGERVDLPRNIALIDTNVLVAMFDPKDSLHAEAQFALEDDDRFWWLVITPVLVEASGLLKKRQGDDAVVAMLRWLVTPGKRVLLFSCLEGPRELETSMPNAANVIARRKIDFVDAYLMRMASVITAACGLAPSAPILTGDGRDFFSSQGTGYQYSLLDVRDPGGDVILIG